MSDIVEQTTVDPTITEEEIIEQTDFTPVQLQGKPIYKNYKPIEFTEEQLEIFSKSISQKTEPSVTEQLKSLKAQLSSTDYQVIKCYEYSLVGMELPYDIQTLHTEREAIREQIRELENTN